MRTAAAWRSTHSSRRTSRRQSARRRSPALAFMPLVSGLPVNEAAGAADAAAWVMSAVRDFQLR